MSLIDDAVANIKARGAQFTDSYNQLMSMKNINRYPSLYPQWKSLKAEGDVIKATVSKILNAIESGVEVVATALNGTPQDGLGFVQALALPVILACIASITYFVSKVASLIQQYKVAEMDYDKKQAIYNNVLAKGGTKEQASAAVSASTPKTDATLGTKIVDMLPVVLIAGALIMFLKRRGE